MDLPGVSIADNEDTAMFCLSSIKAKVCDTHTHTHKLTHTHTHTHTHNNEGLIVVEISSNTLIHNRWKK